MNKQRFATWTNNNNNQIKHTKRPARGWREILEGWLRLWRWRQVAINGVAPWRQVVAWWSRSLKTGRIMKSLLEDRSHNEVPPWRQIAWWSRSLKTGRMMKSLLEDRSHDEVAPWRQVAWWSPSLKTGRCNWGSCSQDGCWRWGWSSQDGR